MRYSEKFKKDFRDQMQDTILKFFIHKIDCKIFIRNFNDWDSPLPEYLQEAKIIELDIKGEVFDFCQIEDDGILLVMIFGEELYSKKLNMFELVGIFDINSTPIMYKPFEDLKTQDDSWRVIYDEDKGIIRCLMNDSVLVI